jgi:hypothetical protein
MAGGAKNFNPVAVRMSRMRLDSDRFIRNAERSHDPG